jgi:hypothetical protein
LEIASLKVALSQVRDAFVVVYSLVVVATIIPGFGNISNAIVIPYYALIPGYYATLLLRNTGTITETFLYSLAWSLAIVASVYSFTTLPGLQYIQVSIVVPVLTIVLLIFVHFRR